jgi:hypothetical protein
MRTQRNRIRILALAVLLALGTTSSVAQDAVLVDRGNGAEVAQAPNGPLPTTQSRDAPPPTAQTRDTPLPTTLSRNPSTLTTQTGSTPPLACGRKTSKPGETSDVSSVLGAWHASDDQSEIKIELWDKGPNGSKTKLRLHTAKRDYQGEFIAGADPQPARMVFTFEPEASDINSQIPAEARSAVSAKGPNRLQWKIQIDPGEKPKGGLVAVWYPGEVQWPAEDPKQAHVTGPGDPITLCYRHAPRVALLAHGANRDYLIDGLYVGVPTMIDLIFDDPYDSDSYAVSIQANGKLDLTATPVDASHRVFRTPVFKPGE